MTSKKKIWITLVFLSALAFTSAVPKAEAKGNEFDAVCDHLKTKYQAKKVKIPFMWLARFAVGIVRPAGVKSFKVTIFRELKFSPEKLNDEMKLVMRDAFSDEWTPILRVRNRDGNQVYMNMREDGKNVKIMLVTIDKTEAVVVRAKFNPEKLAEFIENPSIFGISLDGKENSVEEKIESSESKEQLADENNNDEKKDGN